MKRFTVVGIILSGALSCVSTTIAEVALVQKADPIPTAFLTDVTSSIVTSTHLKRRYRIAVALPDGYSKNHARYPVLFLTDANGLYSTVVETARILATTGQIPDLVIVGIGYPNPGQGLKAMSNPRTFDLTPSEDPTTVKQMNAAFAAKGIPVATSNGGGAPEFLGFIRDELVPSIESRYNVSSDDRAFFGHSFGGLFGVYALLNDHALFKRFLISSPSLDWDNKLMFKTEDNFAASAKTLPARIWFSVGGLEQDVDDSSVGNLQAFVAQLLSHHYQGLESETHVFEDENHVSVVPATISRGLRYIYATPAAPYPAMAPLPSYLGNSAADEIALARSSAPSSISGNADVLTLDGHGYETAIKGDNGFVCLVERSWAMGLSDPEFWNPKFRAPTCYNPAAARTVLPRYLERTRWVLAGISISEMISRTRAEISSNKFTLPEAGAMSYMMSKQGRLSDPIGHWHPHVMFYLSKTAAADWGANLAGSPIFADASTLFAQKGSPEPIITFFVPVTQWSDGTHETMDMH